MAKTQLFGWLVYNRRCAVTAEHMGVYIDLVATRNSQFPNASPRLRSIMRGPQQTRGTSKTLYSIADHLMDYLGCGLVRTIDEARCYAHGPANSAN